MGTSMTPLLDGLVFDPKNIRALSHLYMLPWHFAFVCVRVCAFFHNPDSLGLPLSVGAYDICLLVCLCWVSCVAYSDYIGLIEFDSVAHLSRGQTVDSSQWTQNYLIRTDGTRWMLKAPSPQISHQLENKADDEKTKYTECRYFQP